MILDLMLPYPPTINHYYGRTRTGSMFIKTDGVNFRATVFQIALQRLHDMECNLLSEFVFEKGTKLKLSIEAYMPDNRTRDIDNLLKATLDAITHLKDGGSGGVWEDDKQVDKLTITRVRKQDHTFEHGALFVRIEELA